MYKTSLIIVSLLATLFSVNAQEYKLGILTDFDKSAKLDSTFQVFVNQFNSTLGVGKEVKLLKDCVSYNNIQKENTLKNYTEIVRKTDLVVVVGGNSVKIIAHLKSIPKPTIGIGIIDPIIQGIPYFKGKSNVPNFTYIATINGLESDIVEFRKIVPFKHLTFLVNSGTAFPVNETETQSSLKALKEKLGIKMDVLEISKYSDTLLNKINQESDAVYIADLFLHSDTELQKLARLLVERKLPSFSGKSQDVYHGILASQADELYFDILIRKLGIMVDDALSGKPLEAMNVAMNSNESLIINDKTANELNIKIPFELLFTSKSVVEKNNLKVYSLNDIIELAFKNNLNVAISNQDIELAIQNTKTAKLAVLPNLDLLLNARQINEENASAAFGQPEQLVSGKLQLDQLIYSQKAISGIKIAKYYEKSQEYLTQAQIQEVLVTVLNDYLNVLSAKAVAETEKENLENLEINLKNANLQVKSGYLGSAELYRWESEVAKAKQLVVEASMNLSQYKVTLNKQLAYVLDFEYDLEDITIEDEIYTKFKEGVFSKFVNNVSDVKLITDFLVKESVESNPNKKYIIEQLNALEEQRILNKRLFYIPELSFQGQANQILARGGTGSEMIPGNINSNTTTWNLGIGLKYPIFSQYSRKTELNTTNIEIERLNNSIVQLDNDLEMAVRSEMLTAIATSTNIDFSRISYEKAGENFKLMQLRYKEGDIDITQLIDAQRTYVQSKLRYAVSIYDYIRNQINIEFALGYFYFIAPDDKVIEFKNRFLQYSKSTTNEK